MCYSVLNLLQKKELKGELMVNLIVEGGEGEFNPALTFDRLMTLLNVSTKPEYQLDTPPQTPEIAHREFSAFMNYDRSKISPVSFFLHLHPLHLFGTKESTGQGSFVV